MPRRTKKSTSSPAPSLQSTVQAASFQPLVLTPQQVAALLQVSVGWVYEKSRRRCADPLPVLRIGRYIRFDRSAVVEWLASHNHREKAVSVNRHLSQFKVVSRG